MVWSAGAVIGCGLLRLETCGGLRVEAFSAAELGTDKGNVTDWKRCLATGPKTLGCRARRMETVTDEPAVEAGHLVFMLLEFLR